MPEMSPLSPRTRPEQPQDVQLIGTPQCLTAKRGKPVTSVKHRNRLIEVPLNGDPISKGQELTHDGGDAGHLGLAALALAFRKSPKSRLESHRRHRKENRVLVGG